MPLLLLLPRALQLLPRALLRLLGVACLNLHAARALEDVRAARQWLHLAAACLVALALLHACGPLPAPLLLHLFAEDGSGSRAALLAMDALLAAFCSSFLLPSLLPPPPQALL